MLVSAAIVAFMAAFVWRFAESESVIATNISNESLPAFAALKNLKTLSLNGTRLSEAALRQLQSEMSWCNVRWTHTLEPLGGRN